MKKLLFFLFLFTTMNVLAKNDGPLLQRAKNVAVEYYSSFQQLAALPRPYDEEGVRLQNRILNLAGFDQYGHELSTDFRVSNDIDPILGSEAMGKDVTISNYVGHYVEYAVRNDFSMSYEVISCEQLETPSLRGVRGGTQFVQIVVRKTYKSSGRNANVEETMTIAFDGDKTSMSSISNLYGTSQNAGDLLALALDKYRKHKYYDAFGLFEAVMQKSPGHPDASYYLGIMLYKNRGCKDKYPSRAERDQKAIEYWRMSSLGRMAIEYYTDYLFH